jgi:hypothetical protein
LAATHGKGDSFVNWRMYYKENPNGGHEDRGPAQSGGPRLEDVTAATITTNTTTE